MLKKFEKHILVVGSATMLCVVTGMPPVVTTIAPRIVAVNTLKLLLDSVYTLKIQPGEQTPTPAQHVEKHEKHGYVDGWEDAVARELEYESARQGEEAFTSGYLGETILALKTRQASGSQPSKKLTQRSAICLSTPEIVKTTRCGHLFCESQGRPSWRPGTVLQLRTAQLATA